MKQATSTRSTSYFTPPTRPYRSINISLDLDDPDSLASYVPTNKSVSVLRQIMDGLREGRQERANAIVAPYGSGKSSLLLLLQAALEQRQQWSPVLAKIRQRVTQIDPEVAEGMARATRGRKQLVVSLSGHTGSLRESYKSAIIAALERAEIEIRISQGRRGRPATNDFRLDIPTLGKDLGVLVAALREKGYEGLFFIHDEFGKVLESSAVGATSQDLFFIQNLAEACNRPKQAEVNLLLSLHQGFSQYANKLPAHVRAEWTKVEGRFRQIAFIEDSEQVYELIGHAIESVRSSRFSEIAKRVDEASAPLVFAARRTPFFAKISNPEKLTRILSRAFPLDAGSLFVLPRLSARLAQNERTLFHFLLGAEHTCLVPLIERNEEDSPAPRHVRVADLFDYFEDLMRQDTGTGGTYKRWVEVSTALQRTTDPLERETLKTIGILSLISHEAGVPLTEDVLMLCLVGNDPDGKAAVRKTLGRLVSRKAVLFRKHTDEYRIWEGSDVDLQSLVRQRMAEKDGHFHPIPFLQKHFRPSFVSARRYNDDNAINRFFEGHFCTVPELAEYRRQDVSDPPNGVDGKIYYVLADSEREISVARSAASAIKNPRILFAIPTRPQRLREALLELSVLYDLLEDQDFLSQDPLLRKEVSQLADDVLTHARRLLAGLNDPRLGQASWFHNGKEVRGLGHPKDISRLVSDICSETFSATPRFLNEIVNRKEPSAVIVNARRKLMRAMIEKLGTEHFGLAGHGPDMSTYRALLLNTGLYTRKPGGETWGFAPIDEVKDHKLQKVLRTIDDFLLNTSDAPKDFEGLLRVLIAPPFGLRPGVIPVLLCASVLGYSRGLSLLDDGVYVQEIKPELFDRIITDTAKIKVQCVDFPAHTLNYVNRLRQLFIKLGKQQKPPMHRDPVRTAVEVMYAWVHQLTPFSMATQALPGNALAFRGALTKAKDPVALLMEDLPRLFRGDRPEVALTARNVDGLIADIEESAKALMACPQNAVVSARRILEAAFVLERPCRDLRKGLGAWVKDLPKDILDYLTDPLAAGFVSRTRTAYQSDEQLVESLAALVVGQSIGFWEDSSLKRFEVGVLSIHRVLTETAALLSMREGTGTRGEYVTFVAHKAGKEYCRAVVSDEQLTPKARDLKDRLGALLEQSEGELTDAERQRLLLQLMRKVSR